MFDRAFDALTLDIPQAATQTVSFQTLGETVRAAFTLDTTTLSAGTMYSGQRPVLLRLNSNPHPNP